MRFNSSRSRQLVANLVVFYIPLL